MNRGPTLFLRVARSGLVEWKRAVFLRWLFAVSHCCTSPSPRRWSGRRGLLVSGGRARFVGASASFCLLLVLAARAVRVDGAFLLQNQVRVNSAVRQRLYQRVFCSKLAIVCVCAAILDGCSTARDVYASMAFCFCKSAARYVALHCRGTIQCVVTKNYPAIALRKRPRESGDTTLSRGFISLARVLFSPAQESSGRDGWRPEASRRSATPDEGPPPQRAEADGHKRARAAPTLPPRRGWRPQTRGTLEHPRGSASQDQPVKKGSPHQRAAPVARSHTSKQPPCRAR